MSEVFSYVKSPLEELRDLLPGTDGFDFGTRETRIYSVLSFPRRREPSQIKHLDPHLLGDDELICVSLGRMACLPVCQSRIRKHRERRAPFLLQSRF